MMHRPGAVARPRSICQICESISAQHRRAFIPLVNARNTSRRPHQSRRAAGSLTTPHIPPQSRPPLSRASSSTASPSSHRAPAAKSKAGEGEDEGESESALAQTDHGAAPSLHPASVADIMGYLKTGVARVTASRGIPSEQNVSAALGVCDMLATWFTDESVRPQITHAISELDSTASTLLSLEGEGESQVGAKPAAAAAPSVAPAAKKPTKPAAADPTEPSLPEGLEYSAKMRELINKISETAYLILAHPPVLITPKLLEQYVKIQAKLGRPETLPRIFQLYASKPVPREGASGSAPLSYGKPNPNRAASAVEPETVEAALDTAIEAKNLDAAVGIIENTYATTAFVRSKLLRYGLLPLGAFAATPLAAYVVASNFSGLQQAMDGATATGVAFAGILAYVGFTASIGAVALTTANDQMRRVTWAPGMPLRRRWVREEERAALDRIACAWGFQEPWRQGEEEGADWDALREYIGQKGMMLDRTELMEGME
ncbi:hypothetical protein F5Y14DRAFT_420020 [Nemania sp. NC0429]|nr:hypothetical protein F5Y14DRAFT_420020 [Nemania sp. NC0429]